MKKQVLFIQGGGNGGYKADAPLVASLQAALGSGYESPVISNTSHGRPTVKLIPAGTSLVTMRVWSRRI